MAGDRSKADHDSAADRPRAEVRVERGGPRLFIDGEETFPFFALSVGMGETVAGYTASGIDLFAPIVGLDRFWVAPDEFEWEPFDRFFLHLAEINPRARFLPRVTLTAPRWWKEAHPDQIVRYGLEIPPDRWKMEPVRTSAGLDWNASYDLYDVSLASTIWREETGDALRALIDHVDESPLRSRVIGYQVTSAMTGEWHYIGSEFLPDYSEPMQRVCGEVPPVQKRTTTHLGLLRDPAREGDVIEFYRRFHENTVDTILHFASIVKEATDRQLLCGTFYCYLTENVYIHECGHLAPRRILESGDIDYIASPYTYVNTNIPDREKWHTDVIDGAGNLLGRGRGVAQLRHSAL